MGPETESESPTPFPSTPLHSHPYPLRHYTAPHCRRATVLVTMMFRKESLPFPPLLPVPLQVRITSAAPSAATTSTSLSGCPRSPKDPPLKGMQFGCVDCLLNAAPC